MKEITEPKTFIFSKKNNRFQADVTSGSIEKIFNSNKPNATHFDSTNQSHVHNYSTIVSDSYGTIHRRNTTAGVNNSTDRTPPLYGLIEKSDRHKRDIRSDILESELRIVVKTYNSEATSQAKSASDSILFRSDGLNDLRNLLTLSFNNLATNGLNDVYQTTQICNQL